MKTKIIPHGKQIQTSLPCPHEECGSSDAVTLYLHPEGHKYEKCFSCGKIWDVDNEGETVYINHMQAKSDVTENSELTLPEYVPGDDFWGRGIAEETFDLYNVRSNEDGTQMVFPSYDYQGNLVAICSRTEDKKFNWKGEPKKASLFGASVWQDKGFRKAITVTEGREDTMAVSQMFGNKYACVSIINGASAAKNLSANDIKFLEQFEEIVVCFDSDEPGRKAAKEFAKSFGNTKVSILDLKLKDANEYLKAGLDQEFRDLWFKSRKPYRPDGLVYSSETASFITEHDPKPTAHWKYKGLNDLLWGIYTPSLIVITAGSGVGKTQFVKDLKLHLFNTTTDKLGEMFLEESVKQSVYQLLAIDLKENINNPEIFESVSKDEIYKSWKKLFGDDRWMFWDHFGSSDIDAVCEQVRYLAANFGAKYIVLDHVSIIVSSQENGDERKALDEIMTKLRQLIEELDITIFLVSHLKRPNGSDAHEEGGVTSLAQLRGSAGIGQLSDVVLGLERNGQHDDPFMRNVVTVRVLKSRKTGRTGPACYLLYDNDKASFTEIDKERIEEHIEELKAAKNLKDTVDSPIMDENFGDKK